MKALIAAGGRATRLRPITWTINKHLIPLANQPMLVHAIRKITEAGIKDVIVNVNPGELEIMKKAIGDGREFNATIRYVEQKGGAQGIAHAVNNAKELLEGEPFMFYLGDNIMLGSLQAMVDQFQTEDCDCVLAFSKVKDPQRFGVPEFDQAGNLIKIIEKPSKPPSDFAQTGVFIYNDSFFDLAFANIQPSDRGEYEISDVNTWLLQNGYKVGHEEVTGWWKDTGKHSDLLEGNALIMDEMKRGDFKIANDTNGAAMQGLVHIGEETTFGKDVLIRGPVIVGDNCHIENAYIGPYTSIGNGVIIKNTEIEHSIIFDEATIDCRKRIVDSLVGLKAQVISTESSLPRGHRMVIGDNSMVEL